MNTICEEGSDFDILHSQKILLQFLPRVLAFRIHLPSSLLFCASKFSVQLYLVTYLSLPGKASLQKNAAHRFDAPQRIFFSGKEADPVAEDTDGEEAEDDEERIDALLQEIHAGKRHEKRDDAGHEAVEDGLERRDHVLPLAVCVLGEHQGHVDRRPLCHEGPHDEKT